MKKESEEQEVISLETEESLTLGKFVFLCIILLIVKVVFFFASKENWE